MSYEYNYENATEKRKSQAKYGRLDIPHDSPENHPEHLKQHEHLQILQREALNGNIDKVKEMIEDNWNPVGFKLIKSEYVRILEMRKY